MANTKNTHPGKILLTKFVIPSKISNATLARALHIASPRVSEILTCKRSITVDTALRLSKYFGNSPIYWLNLQNDFDIKKEIKAKKAQYNSIKKLSRKTTGNK